MKRTHKILLIAVPAALALTGGITAGVLAAPRPTLPTTANERAVAVTSVARPTDKDYAAWGCPFFTGNLDQVTTLLGMTPAEIQAQLQAGKSLVDIAATKGVTEDQLVNAILGPMQTFMQEQVTASRWTQAQVDARLQYAEQHIRQLVETKGLSFNNGLGNGYGCGGRGFGGMMRGLFGNDRDETPGPGPATNGSGTSNTYGGMMGGFGGAGFRGMMGRY